MTLPPRSTSTSSSSSAATLPHSNTNTGTTNNTHNNDNNKSMNTLPPTTNNSQYEYYDDVNAAPLHLHALPAELSSSSLSSSYNSSSNRLITPLSPTPNLPPVSLTQTSSRSQSRSSSRSRSRSRSRAASFSSSSRSSSPSTKVLDPKDDILLDKLGLNLDDPNGDIFYSSTSSLSRSRCSTPSNMMDSQACTLPCLNERMSDESLDDVHAFSSGVISTLTTKNLKKNLSCVNERMSDENLKDVHAFADLRTRLLHMKSKSAPSVMGDKKLSCVNERMSDENLDDVHAFAPLTKIEVSGKNNKSKLSCLNERMSDENLDDVHAFMDLRKSITDVGGTLVDGGGNIGGQMNNSLPNLTSPMTGSTITIGTKSREGSVVGSLLGDPTFLLETLKEFDENEEEDEDHDANIEKNEEDDNGGRKDGHMQEDGVDGISSSELKDKLTVMTIQEEG